MRGIGTILLITMLVPAAWAEPRAAEPFERIEIETPPPRSHLVSYLTMASGAALIGVSFAWADHANGVYDDYLAATDPDRIESLFEETERYDRRSSLALLTGEALIVTGLYLRFLRPSPVPLMGYSPAPSSRWSLSLSPRRCALVLQL